uniref:Uncharacterized protein n=1 Tax=Anguilla anguilla TaxID=7936 RepID=A0A0E9QS38_ANGAN
MKLISATFYLHIAQTWHLLSSITKYLSEPGSGWIAVLSTMDI